MRIDLPSFAYGFLTLFILMIVLAIWAKYNDMDGS